MGLLPDYVFHIEKRDTLISVKCEDKQTNQTKITETKGTTSISATAFIFRGSSLQVCEIGHETFKERACLIFHAPFSWGQDKASVADTKSNRCQARWNMYGPPNGRSGDDISKHAAQWMFTQCEKKNWSVAAVWSEERGGGGEKILF